MSADAVPGWRTLVKEAVYEPHFAAGDKRDALRKISRLLLAPRGFSADSIERVAFALQKREYLGSTGVGRGVGVPHTKFNGIDRLIAGWFRLNEPMEFESLDGEPVWYISCLISPPDRPGDHLRVMENLSRLHRNDAFLQVVRLDPEQLNADTILKFLG